MGCEAIDTERLCSFDTLAFFAGRGSADGVADAVDRFLLALAPPA